MEWLATPLAALVTSGGTIFIAVLTMHNNSKIKRIDQNAKATAEQTVNNHQDAEYPNLREEQTAMREKVNALSRELGEVQGDVKAVRGMVHGVSAAVDRVEDWLKDVGKGTAFLEDTISRKELAAAQALAAAIEDRTIEFQKRDREFEGLRRELPGVVSRAVDAALKNRNGGTNA